MNKILNYILHVIIILLIIVCVRQIRALSSIKIKCNQQVNSLRAIDDTIAMQDKLLGRKFLPPKLMNIFKPQEKIQMISSKKYIAVIVFGKLSCSSCMIEITQALEGVQLKNIDIIGISNSEKILLQDALNKSGFRWPMFYAENSEWFMDMKMMHGPYILILDSDSLKVVSIFSQMYFYGISDRTHIMLDFIKRYNF